MSDKIKKYFDLLMKWNSRINLTSVSDFETFQKKHIDDAKALVPHLDNAKSLIDLGSGAGLPGILIKIEKPKIDIVLLEATKKKVSFCEEAIRQLGLKNILAVWGRAEDEGLMRGLGAFDVVVSRATWNLTDYLGVASRYLGSGGICIAMKGAKWRDELVRAEKVLEENGLIHEDAVEYDLKDGEKRCLLIFRKLGKAVGSSMQDSVI